MQSLQPFHTFNIPANAREIIAATSIEHIQQAWQKAQAEKLPVLFLGQGSNMLFLEDFQGIVIVNRLLGIQHTEDSDYHYLLCLMVVKIWHELVEWSLSQGINGLENLALIPGRAGSAPIQNIGAYGVEFKDVCD